MTFPSEFRWTSAARSDTGCVRQINEDALLDAPTRGVWAVADGMGGHAVGDLASRMVIESLTKVKGASGLTNVLADARARLLRVNEQLRAEAARRQVSRIGSTVVLLITRDRACGYLWAGDSRIYLLRRGNLVQLTRDHSHVEELKARGQLTAEEALHHPAQHLITRAVGALDVLELDENTLELRDGDTFLLCSDGLSNEVSEAEMANELASGDCDTAAQRLLEIALSRGGRDNISVVVAHAEDLMASDKTQVNPGV
ncbi:protein phosphatase 2C domain-containing protein [Caballeronia sp. LZ035]|uniref:PP2C family protein-serine/threonine phosphatase n=1 Tax=Caballeronia sp. LZ035 TaxID=3038568 RepID=UPI002866CC3B|nr:protein phosphatase 2C domain-containing protein [Caballeronia sp. LZ035]MDR5762464.1 protein phosphatase 2C domain-containing protein [Caballeronia sp. LZ035]